MTTKNSLKSIFLLVCLIVSFSLASPAEEISNKRFMVTAAANLFRSASNDYRKIYSQAVFMPEIKITALVYRNFTAWGSIAFISKDGYIEEVDEQAHINQTILGLGLGYAREVSAKLRLRGELGLTSISFKEEALEETQKGSGLGWRIGANLDYFLSKKMFVTLTTAYSQASDEAQTGKIELGGFQLGAGLGFTF